MTRAEKVIERVYSHILKEYGIRPYCQFSGAKGYHIIVPLEPVQAGDKAKEFLKFMQIQLSKGYCDPQILGDIVRLFRIPDTINSKSGRLCETVREWDGNRLDPSLLWEEFRAEELDRILRERKRPRLRVRKQTKKGGIRPQILLLMQRIEEGQNLGHLQRLAVLTELIAKGWEDEQILELFSKAPDFNESKTRYYIAHARLRGYKPFSSAKLGMLA
ncbi:MAG: hypothetical protein H5T32_03800 [Candidatus Methanosuratus sp.]|nr:hypothetical protein [Candidatus Methanosuratincola sp.]